MEIRFTRSARRHRIGVARALHVMFSIEPTLIDATEIADARLTWLGEDDRGLRLEIIALVLPDLLLVIHVMPNDFRGGRK